MKHHQEAGQHHEKVDAQIGLVEERQCPAGQGETMTDQHPKRSQCAQTVKAINPHNGGFSHHASSGPAMRSFAERYARSGPLGV